MISVWTGSGPSTITAWRASRINFLWATSWCRKGCPELRSESVLLKEPAPMHQPGQLGLSLEPSQYDPGEATLRSAHSAHPRACARAIGCRFCP